MTLAEGVLVVMFAGGTLYAVFGGADFGAGIWDLLSGRTRSGAPARALIEKSIGPVWEANHVWLIFALVILWSGFPSAFAAVMGTLYIPLTLAAVGIIARGSAFAFRKAVVPIATKRTYGVAFALSSVLTPFFLGTVVGAVASGRVTAYQRGAAAAPIDPIGSWWNPTSMLGGTMAVLVCAYLAATYLTAEAARRQETLLAEAFRRRAMATGVLSGVVALVGIAVLASDAPRLFDGLSGRALPLLVVSAAGAGTSFWLLAARRYRLSRWSAAVAVGAVLWGWAAGQYPEMLVGQLSIEAAAGSRAALVAMLISLAIGAVLFIPALVVLLWMAQRGDLDEASTGPARTAQPAAP
ncbi:MAG: cytochrome d ubiquinol oxidase subunit II [Acidimicrobiales bacterium]